MDVARTAYQVAYLHDYLLDGSVSLGFRGTWCLMVIRLGTTPARFPIKVLCIPLKSILLFSIPSV